MVKCILCEAECENEVCDCGMNQTAKRVEDWNKMKHFLLTIPKPEWSKQIECLRRLYAFYNCQRIADGLGVSKQSINQDKNLAYGVQENPHLLKCPNKTLAQKSYERIRKYNLEKSDVITHSESDVEKMLLHHWENIIQFKDWKIIKNQYKTDDKKNSLDILTKHKTENKYLVIEVKRNIFDDDRYEKEVLSQTLKYMGKIKKDKALAPENVEGMIIIGKVDDELDFALEFTKNISCYIYTMETDNISLISPQDYEVEQIKRKAIEMESVFRVLADVPLLK